MFINQTSTIRHTNEIMTSTLSRKTIRLLTKCRHFQVRNKSYNSSEWLKRREEDPYVEISRKQNYRCRSAFKLIEIDDKFKFIKPGFKVLDVGAAPGSWSQVLANRTNSNGKDGNVPVGLVIAVDLNYIQDIDGVVTLFNTDFLKETSQKKILQILGKEEKFDFVCSDMAPSATGVKNLDQERIMNLVYSVVYFAVKNLKAGGGCLVKVWDGGDIKSFRNELSRFFRLVSYVKPNASYQSSPEAFILARDFKSLKT